MARRLQSTSSGIGLTSRHSVTSLQPRESGLTTYGRIKLLGVVVVLAGHAATLVVGASAETYTGDDGEINYGITAIHILLIPIAFMSLAVLKNVFRCSCSSFDGSDANPNPQEQPCNCKWSSCTFDRLFFHPILTYVVVAIITMWIILYREYVHDTKEGEVPSCDDQTSIFAAMYHGKGELDIENLLFVMVQAIPVIALIAMALLPVFIPSGLGTEERRKKVKERNDQYYELLIVGLAMTFDIVDLQGNVHEDKLKGNHKLVIIILVFSTLSLLQLAQLSSAWRFYFLDSVPWQVFWSFYGTVFQEIPFLSIRLYILGISGAQVHDLIFPLKNALGIALNVYDIYSKCKEEKEKSERKEEKEKWETLQLGFNLFCPLAVLLSHLVVLIWRVVVVRGASNAGLAVLLVPFIGVSLVRLVQLVQKLRTPIPPSHDQNFELQEIPKPKDQPVPSLDQQDGSKSTAPPPASWFETWFQRLILVIYVIVAFTLDVLLVQGLRDTEEGFSDTKIKRDKCKDDYGSLTTQQTPTVTVFDNLSFLIIQLSFPLVVFARAWMPRGELTFTRYSSLLALDLTIAFDIAEFGKVLVDVLTDSKVSDEADDNILNAFFVFMIAGMLLLATMEGGLESVSALRKIIWTALLVLCLDGPFLVIRLYVMTQYEVDIDDMELIFLLKNVLFIIFGIYRVVTLILECRNPKKENENWQQGNQSTGTGSAYQLQPAGGGTEKSEDGGLVISNDDAMDNQEISQNTGYGGEQTFDDLIVPIDE